MAVSQDDSLRSHTTRRPREPRRAAAHLHAHRFFEELFEELEAVEDDDSVKCPTSCSLMPSAARAPSFAVKTGAGARRRKLNSCGTSFTCDARQERARANAGCVLPPEDGSLPGLRCGMPGGGGAGDFGESKSEGALALTI